ncbi:MAG: 50S ribosomal protein L4 [Alphaproteobacteria bacterium]|jgi:large subunit ribosomal protein L4|nr:50S ribosomal protein L4 [Alphaproteobacteria bacterium]
MKLDVLTLDNKVVEQIDLSKDIFGLDPQKSILHRVVLWQLAKRRSGNHKVKVVSEVSGTGKKPFKQKGTGAARQGSLRSHHMRGGGKIHGPVVRDHGFSLQKKVRALGLKMALSSKMKEKNLIVIDSEKTKAASAKTLKAQFTKLGLDKVLVIGGEALDENFKKSSANIKHADVLPVQGANVYDILKHEKLVLTKEAVAKLEARFAK